MLGMIVQRLCRGENRKREKKEKRMEECVNVITSVYRRVQGYCCTRT
jgi:hypothetical protein